ncbi:MAG: acyl-CoA dehydrogenase [Gammaproteobacteria bacterium]
MHAQHLDTTAEPTFTDMLRESVADFCRGALEPRRLRDLHADGQDFDRARWREMAELGWAGLLLPEDAGGLGQSAREVAAVARELGRVVAPEPFIETAVAALGLALAAGGADALAEVCAGERVCVAALGAASLDGVAARRAGEGWTLDGEIAQVPLGLAADLLLVPARTAGELLLFLLPADAPGLLRQPLPLADGGHDARLRLTNVACAAPLGAMPEAAARRALELAAVANGAYLLGLCEALNAVTLDYLRTRRQFGRAIGSFQALQHRAVDCYLHTRLAGVALEAALLACAQADADALALAAARLRHRVSETATRVVREAIQLHGAIGYTEQCDVSLYVQRALVMSARLAGAMEALRAMPALLHGARGADQALPPPLPDDHQPADGDWNTVDDALFRSTLRHWIERNYPPELRHAPGQLRWAELAEWHGRLVARGWAAPAWPREHGGMGLAPGKMLIFIEELERHGVARAPDQGIVMIGPILIALGNEDQRARYLSAALTGEQIWCQGYSEPNAGSDLASLATTAVLDGDEFIVNGQKTWTTHGLDATHMYCLVRTDSKVKPQAGISFLLIDLDQPGVTVRPIVNLGGHVDFCEVFLDNVRVPRANLVGELNQGWTIAKSLLGHERLFVGSPKLCQHALHQLREIGVAGERLGDPIFADQLARAALDVLDLEALYEEYAAIVKAGGTPGADISILKIWSTETYVRLSEQIVAAAGEAGGNRGPLAFGTAQVDVLSHFYNARPAPIYAGSNEIQRNIIAKAVLDLPT